MDVHREDSEQGQQHDLQEAWPPQARCRDPHQDEARGQKECRHPEETGIPPDQSTRAENREPQPRKGPIDSQ
jgi:hypothetical protein